MKKLIPLFLALIPIIAFSQNDLDYKNLQLPDVKLNALQFDLNGSYRANKLNSYYNIPIRVQSFGYNNKRYNQFFYDASFSFISSNQNAQSNIESKNIKPSLNLSLDYYKYNKKYLFIHTGLKSYNNYENNKEDLLNTSNKKNVNTTYNTAYLGVGKGRIDPIDWGQRAGFLNEYLLKTSSISRAFTQDELLKVAEKIARLDRQRFYNTRYYKIKRIKSIDTLIRSFNIIADEASYFASLDDIYFMAPINLLSTGYRIELFGEFNSQYMLGNYTSDSLSKKIKTEQINNQIVSGLSFNYHLPINLHWAHVINAKISYNKALESSINYNDENSGYLFNNLILFDDAVISNVGYELKWLPSTRTFLSFKTDVSLVSTSAYNELHTSNTIQLNYFVSSRLKYAFNANYTSISSNKAEYSYNLNLSASLSYQLW